MMFSCKGRYKMDLIGTIGLLSSLLTIVDVGGTGFKALKNNYLRQFEYSYVKTKKDVEDIENLEILYSEVSEKTTKDLWVSFQFQYILEQIEKHFTGNILQIYKCYYYLGYSDIRMDSKFGKDWKKEVRSVNKWIKTNVDFSNLKYEFYKSFPDVDEEVF